MNEGAALDWRTARNLFGGSGGAGNWRLERAEALGSY